MDAVALAAVISSGAVGLGGLVLTAKNSKAERAARKEEAAAARDHERATGQRARLFERQADTYVELLVYVGRMATNIAGAYPMMTFRRVGQPPDEEEPPAPTAEEIQADDEALANLEARVSAYGSSELVELVETYLRQSRTFWLDVGTFETVKAQHGTSRQLAEARRGLQTSREETQATYGAIRQRVREELAAP